MKNKILTLLLSLVISFGLWLYVVTVVSPETEGVIENISVTLNGTAYLDARELMVVSSDQITMDLTLRGNRADLKHLNNENITVLADLTKIDGPGTYELSYSIFYPGSIQSGNLEEIRKEPQKITVEIAKRETVTMDIEVQFLNEDAVPVGFEPDKKNYFLDHTKVTVSGPKETVDRIAYASISVDLSEQTSDITGSYPLTIYDVDGKPVEDRGNLTVNVSEVHTVVNIYQIKEVPVVSTLDDTDSGLRKDMATIFHQQTITLMGNSTKLASIDKIDLGTIYLKNFREDETISVNLPLPEGVTTRDGKTQIPVQVNLPDMTSKTFEVTRFKRINENGLQVYIEAPSVEIWGPADMLEEVTADMIVCVVDCADLVVGKAFVPAIYEIEGYEYLRVEEKSRTVFVLVSKA